MSQALQAVRGMNDILPDQTPHWQWLETRLHAWLAAFGYQEIRTPIVEQAALFSRAIGEVTDIVEKEMYTFTDALNGEQLALRPEGTAACVRAVIEHSLLYQGPRRLWYQGAMFRHERPQKGRYRQFHQLGIEAMGFADAELDAEHLVMAADLWQRLGLSDLTLEINTLGDSTARARHRSKLIAYFTAHESALDEDARRRLHSNPLRILDSKNPAMQAIVEAAPKLMDEIDDIAIAHFETVQRILRAHDIAFTINPRLVRGLDYYNHTVFEWVSHQLGAQGTVCAGGRYDGLMAQMGGKPAPACGFAIGLERLLLLCEIQAIDMKTPPTDVYIVHQGEAAQHHVWQIARQLRQAGISTLLHCGGGNFKAQMKKADASGARFAVIIGDNEIAAQQITLKSLRLDLPQQAYCAADAIQHILTFRSSQP